MDALQSRRTSRTGQAIVAVLVAAFVLLIGRLVYINQVHGPQLLAKAARQQRSIIPLPHRRGLVVDCNGRIVSGTLLRKSVFADPKVLEDPASAAQTVAEIVGVSQAELSEDFLAAGDQRFLVIRRGVTQDQAERIKAANVHGLGIFDEPYRTYPMNGLAAALVGFVATDGHGVSGLEYQCEQWLQGENGVKTIVRDAKRKAFYLADTGYQPPRDGFHIVLTIDAEIQSAAERELTAAVEKYHAESGVAIVMDPKTGAILAMANVPGFDPNSYGDYGASRYRNQAITDPFEPGSTFKPFVVAGGLTTGAVRLGEVFDCEQGLFQDGKRTLHDHHPYGLLTLEDVVVKSSNIGMAKVGKKLGNERLFEAVRAFGFGDKTGIDLVGEDPGMVHPLPRWNSFTTTSVPMGHEVNVTPLQLARGFCAFANGGKLVQPYVIRAVLRADGQLLEDLTPPDPPAEAIPEDIANTMKDKILCEVVNRGTGTKAQLSRYQVFGKTGTAQIARAGGGGYKQRAYVGSFVASAPASDPRVVVLVSIRRPDPAIGYYGGTISAPAVQGILAHTLAYLQVPPDKEEGDTRQAAHGVGGD